MRWLIFFLLVANVALFFWLQQQSRPAPGSTVLPSPDVGTLRLRHEQGRQQAPATDQVATEVPPQDAATPGGSMAELHHVEQMPRVPQSLAADEDVDVEPLPEQAVPPGGHGSQKAGEPAGQSMPIPEMQAWPTEPSVPAFGESTPPEQAGLPESLSDGPAGLLPQQQTGSTELSSPERARPVEPVPGESVGSTEPSPPAWAGSADPAPEDQAQKGPAEPLAEEPGGLSELLPQEGVGPTEPLPRGAVAPTVPASVGRAEPSLPEALAPPGPLGQEQSGSDQPSVQEQVGGPGLGQTQGQLEWGSGSLAPNVPTEVRTEANDAVAYDAEPGEIELPVPASSGPQLAVCARVGPLIAQDAESFVAKLPTHITLLSDVAEEYTDVTGYYVLIPPLASRAEGIRKLRELREAGVDDIWLFRSGEFNNAISLGLFSREQTARRHAANVGKKGFAAEIRNRTSISERRWLELKYTDGVDLATQVPLPDGATVELLPCP